MRICDRPSCHAGHCIHKGAQHRLEAQVKAALDECRGASRGAHGLCDPCVAFKACAQATGADIIDTLHCVRLPGVLCQHFVSRAWSLQVRDKFHIICEGDNLPPAVTDFADARLPLSIMKHLESKGIKRPTPIQMQVRFSSRQANGAFDAFHCLWCL